MKCRGYSEIEVANRTLQMQVHCAVDQFREDTPRPPDALVTAITALLALGSMANAMKWERGGLLVTNMWLPKLAGSIFMQWEVVSTAL